MIDQHRNMETIHLLPSFKEEPKYLACSVNLLGFENAKSRFEPVTFGFSDLPEREADALLIRPPRLVAVLLAEMFGKLLASGAPGWSGSGMTGTEKALRPITSEGFVVRQITPKNGRETCK